jgi:3-methyladenine DNA glycosylase/8-oxoguanine DNA glycosylase
LRIASTARATLPGVVVETTLRPATPYALARSAAGLRCATRRMRGGLLDLAFPTPAGPASATVAQRRDGTLAVRIHAPDPAAALERLRFLLAVDLDLASFYRTVADDGLLGPLTRRLRGYRPLRLGSLAHALLRGVAGQLVRSSEARRVEMVAVRAVGCPHGDLHLPPTADDLRTLSPARLRGFGLAEKRARVLARAARELDLDGLWALDTARAVRRITAIPGIGPWTAGVVCLQGLGRTDHGLVGDLGLAKLLARHTGTVPDVAATARLLERYAPFQGLASVYLLAGAPATRTPATVAEIARAVAPPP